MAKPKLPIVQLRPHLVAVTDKHEGGETFLYGPFETRLKADAWARMHSAPFHGRLVNLVPAQPIDPRG